MRTRKEKYQNQRTKEIRVFEAEVDGNNHIPMYQYTDGDEWKSLPKWTLNVVNSSEFFASGHEPRVKFSKPPLDGSDMPYGIT
jgi:hypothetical protein